jgi:dTMP kinase
VDTVRGMSGGRLITIEGVDGSGKTTLATGLADALRATGIEVRVLREPGGVQLAERIRELVHDPALNISPRTEALLFAAARAQLVIEALEPLLRAGTWIVLDRFVDSSLAYQGRGRSLGVGAIAEINRFATGGLTPDRTLLLKVRPELGRARARARQDTIDRLEREHDDFFQSVAAAYEELAELHPERIRVIDANEPPERVMEAALSQISDLLPPGAEIGRR